MYTDIGYNTSAGFGYNFNSYVGALINLNVDSVGVNSVTLNNIGLPGGKVNVFSATLDPIVHLIPHGIAPSSQISSSSSVNKPGFDAGMGIAVGSQWRGKFYAEAKYNRIFLSGPFHMDYVPVTFGYRW